MVACCFTKRLGPMKYILVNVCFYLLSTCVSFKPYSHSCSKYFEVRNNIQIIHNKNLIWSNIAYTNFINYIIKNICSISQHQNFWRVSGSELPSGKLHSKYLWIIISQAKARNAQLEWGGPPSRLLQSRWSHKSQLTLWAPRKTSNVLKTWQYSGQDEFSDPFFLRLRF